MTAHLQNPRRLHKHGHHLVELYHLVPDHDQGHLAGLLQLTLTDKTVSEVAGTEVGAQHTAFQGVEVQVALDGSIEIEATHKVPLEGHPHQEVQRYRRTLP